MKQKKEKLFQLAYHPQRDITAWELAQVVALNMELAQFSRPVPESALLVLDASVKRHYVLKDVTSQYHRMLLEAKGDRGTGEKEK